MVYIKKVHAENSPSVQERTNAVSRVLIGYGFSNWQTELVHALKKKAYSFPKNM